MPSVAAADDKALTLLVQLRRHRIEYGLDLAGAHAIIHVARNVGTICVENTPLPGAHELGIVSVCEYLHDLGMPPMRT